MTDPNKGILSRKVFQLAIVAFIPVLTGLFFSTSLLDEIPLYYDVLGQTWIICGGIYVLTGLLLRTRRNWLARRLLIIGVTLLAAGGSLAVFYYGHSSSMPENSNQY